ncbi:hypothetical protein Vretimale_18211 [Volvox reticuliferus]|uniref:Uncharacterized protein n=1 Tax=Volvox reticuliferus TaxID=1737510 RepID=A0A8J4GWG7_9CHLO|nr:hypothetical protein Vretifemale_17990 [Volvox reticuliferus]GIM15438.1 hypothetical protein Vretimale_18211 [Volvox reticuliferus]
MRYAVVQPFAYTPTHRCVTLAHICVRHERVPRQLTRTYAGDNEKQLTTQSNGEDGLLAPEEISRLASLRRQQQTDLAKDSNVVQGALEEAQLITWPSREKALLDTVLVLFIVAASGAMIFGMNVLLAEASEWWYHLA